MSARRWRKSFKAQGMVEYSLLLLLIAMAVFASLALLGPPVTDLLSTVAGKIPS